PSGAVGLTERRRVEHEGLIERKTQLGADLRSVVRVAVRDKRVVARVPVAQDLAFDVEGANERVYVVLGAREEVVPPRDRATAACLHLGRLTLERRGVLAHPFERGAVPRLHVR